MKACSQRRKTSLRPHVFFTYREMTEEQKKWVIAKNRMMDAMKSLDFPETLGEEMVKNLGSPKAMDRMTSYLNNVKPKKAELVVDEMLAKCSDVARWKSKKEIERANAKYNEILYFGLGGEEE